MRVPKVAAAVSIVLVLGSRHPCRTSGERVVHGPDPARPRPTRARRRATWFGSRDPGVHRRLPDPESPRVARSRVRRRHRPVRPRAEGPLRLRRVVARPVPQRRSEDHRRDEAASSGDGGRRDGARRRFLERGHGRRRDRRPRDHGGRTPSVRPKGSERLRVLRRDEAESPQAPLDPSDAGRGARARPRRPTGRGGAGARVDPFLGLQLAVFRWAQKRRGPDRRHLRPRRSPSSQSMEPRRRQRHPLARGRPVREQLPGHGVLRNRLRAQRARCRRR